MSSIGETLRRERQKRNLELDQISRELKIPHRFLEAIEDERFEGLPAGVFAKNFVRQYANLLGLDGEAIAAEVQRTIAPEPVPGSPVFTSLPPSDIHLPRMETWESIGDRRNVNSVLPALALVVVVMLVCSGVYAFWQRTHHEPTAQTAEPAAAVVHAPAPAQPAPTPAAPQASQPGAASAPSPANQTASASAPGNAKPTEPNSADRPAPENHPSVPAPAAANPAAANPAGAASAAATPANPQTPANPANPQQPPTPGSVHVELSAQEPVWVLVRSNGKYLFSGTLEANQTRTIDADGTVILRLGNAGGISISLNGKPIGPVGPKGQIREVQLTSGGFHILAAPKPPSPAGGAPGATPSGATPPSPASTPPGDPR